MAGRPPVIARREAKRQAKLAQERPAPNPAEVLTQHEYCWIQGFHSWSELPVPMNVLLIRERYADGHCQEATAGSSCACWQVRLHRPTA